MFLKVQQTFERMHGFEIPVYGWCEERERLDGGDSTVLKSLWRLLKPFDGKLVPNKMNDLYTF